MIQDLSELNEGDKTVLFISGALDELTRMGYMRRTGESIMTPKGVSTWDQLVADGFVPDRNHVIECLEVLDIVQDTELGANVIMDFAFKLLPEQQESHA